MMDIELMTPPWVALVLSFCTILFLWADRIHCDLDGGDLGVNPTLTEDPISFTRKDLDPVWFTGGSGIFLELLNGFLQTKESEEQLQLPSEYWWFDVYSLSHACIKCSIMCSLLWGFCYVSSFPGKPTAQMWGATPSCLWKLWGGFSMSVDPEQSLILTVWTQ